MSRPKFKQGEQHWKKKQPTRVLLCLSNRDFQVQLPVLIVSLKIPAWLDTWWKTSRPLCPGAPLFSWPRCVLWHDVILKHTMGKEGKFLITSGLLLFPTTVWIGFFLVYYLKKKNQLSCVLSIHLQDVAFNFCGFFKPRKAEGLQRFISLNSSRSVLKSIFSCRYQTSLDRSPSVEEKRGETCWLRQKEETAASLWGTATAVWAVLASFEFS